MKDVPQYTSLGIFCKGFGGHGASGAPACPWPPVRFRFLKAPCSPQFFYDKWGARPRPPGAGSFWNKMVRRNLAFYILRQDALCILNKAQTESTLLYRTIQQLACQKNLESSDENVSMFFRNIVKTVASLGLPCKNRLLNPTEVHEISSQIDILYQRELEKIWPRLLISTQLENPEQNLNPYKNLNVQDIREWLNNNSALLRNVTRLDLDRQSLNILPHEIGYFTNLRLLNLANNQLTTIPTEIGNFTALEWLNLSRNSLSSIPAEVGHLSALKHLFLYDNQLTTIPAEVVQLRNKALNVYGFSGPI